MASAPGRIRDPVHGYIAFTAIERAILDHPIAQRLRYVAQSAAAHLVFPDMRVSRFAHSLGAMHLASRFLQASLANARESERTRLVSGLNALVEVHQGMSVGSSEQQLLAEQGLLAGRAVDGADRVSVLLVEQGLRLASLLHDLGHLPFSHDFEDALTDHLRATGSGLADVLLAQGPGGDKVHERVGYALAAVVQRDVFDTSLEGGPLAKPAEIALLIAQDILNAPGAPQLVDDPRSVALSWLHQLVSGELDVDRADYVLRDVRHYGITAAGYDLDRLVDNLVPATHADGHIVTAVLPQGTSAAESLCVARFRMYAWAIYHHKVQQAAAGLRVSIAAVLGDSRPDVDEFLARTLAIAGRTASPEDVAQFAQYDDLWWTGIMRNALSSAPEHVAPWMGLFLERRPGPASLWKRAHDFPLNDRAAWNRRLPSKDDLDLRERWEQIARELSEEGVLVVRLPFKPWDPAPDGESQISVLSQSLEPLTRLSPLTKALSDAWENEVQVMAFVRSPGLVTPGDVLERLEPALKPA